MNNLNDNLEIYFKIYDDIINNYNIKNINYILLENMNDINIYMNKFIENINKIINEKNINKKLIYTINNYNNMFNKDISPINDIKKIEEELIKQNELLNKKEENIKNIEKDKNEQNMKENIENIDKNINKFIELFSSGNYLLEYFLILGLEPEIYKNEWLYDEDIESIMEKHKDDIKPKIISQFPPFKKTTLSFDDSIINYCFPEGFHFIKNKDNTLKEFNFSFILPNRDFNEKFPFKYFSCMIFYEKISNYRILYNAKAKYSDNLTQESDNKEDNLKVNDIYIPKCLVLISLYPYFTIFEKINKEIYKYFLNKESISKPIDKIIENLLIEVGAPPRGIYQIQFFLNNELISLSGNVMNKLPLLDINLKIIFNNFDENDIINIYNYIFLESKIIFYSKNINYLYQIIYSFISFLYPFEYFQIITFLPKERFKFFESSSTFIIGILDNDFDFEKYFFINKKALNDCDMIVDIDNKKINILNKNNKIPEFPKNHKKLFSKKLKDLINQSKSNPQGKNDSLNNLFIELFFTFNANLLYNYNEYIDFNFYFSNKKNFNDFFNVNQYLKKCSSGERNFYKAFIETQIFQNFIYHKMIPKNSFEIIKVIQFDEKINQISKKLNKSKNYLEQTNKYEIEQNYIARKPLELEETENEYYNNKENKKKLIDYGVIISEDKNNNNKVSFYYPVFPKLTKFNFNNIYDYYLPPKYDDEIEKINIEIISKISLLNNSNRIDEMESYLYLNWICIFSLTFWYCEENEKNYWFQELFNIVKKSLCYDINVFNYLFESLSKYGNEFMILKLYAIIIKNKWYLSYKIYNIAMKIIENEKENNLLRLILEGKLEKEYKKQNFNKRVFGTKFGSKIIKQFEFNPLDICIICGETINLELSVKNFKEMQNDQLWIQCPKCRSNLLPKLKIKIKYQTEINKNEETIEENITLLSPSSLVDACLSMFDYKVNFDVNEFIGRFSSFFWGSIFLFKVHKLEYDFMLPYYKDITGKDFK